MEFWLLLGTEQKLILFFYIFFFSGTQSTVDTGGDVALTWQSHRSGQTEAGTDQSAVVWPGRVSGDEVGAG